MSAIREIHVVPNTHWDREFRDSFEITRDHLVEMMDETIRTLDADPAYRSYTLDAHCILVEDYLDIRPEMRETVIRLMRERRLLVGPWYTLPDTPNIGAESLARNFLWARKFADRYGIELMRVGYTPCNWGQPSQMPQIFRQLGIDSALIYRGISPHECPAEWIWVAPDGSEIVGHRFALFARYNWYYFVFRPVTYGIDPFGKGYRLGDFGESVFRRIDVPADGLNLASFRVLNPDPAAFIEENLVPAIDRLLEMEAGHYASPYFLAMHGHDVSVAHPMDPRAVERANALQNRYRIVLSDLETYMDKVKAFLAGRDDVVRLHGERRMNLKEGYWTYLLPGTISARTYLKMDNARTERVLALVAEPLASLAMTRGAAYPARGLERAWDYVIQCHTHDAIAGCAPDNVIRDLEFRLRQARDLAETATTRSMQHVAASLDLADAPPDGVNIVVFNSLPYARSENATIEVAFPKDTKAQDVEIVDGEGTPVDVQIHAVERDSFFVDSIWDVPKNTPVVKMTLTGRFPDVPGLGYRTFEATPLAAPRRRRGSLSPESGVLENGRLRVEARPNGTVDVVHRESGRAYRGLNALRDEGVAGNAWKHVRPVLDTIQSSAGGSARWSLVSDGPLEATLRAELSLEVPADLENRELADGAIVVLPIAVDYTLRCDDPMLRIRTVVDNTARDHWLRAVFPTGIRAEVSRAETHFDVVERPIAKPDCSGWVEDVSGTAFMQSAAYLEDERGGLAVLSEGLLEYEVFDEANRPLALTLLRAMWIKLEVSEEKKQILPDLGMQCPGRQVFEYAVLPFGAGTDCAEILRQAQRRRVPLLTAQVGRSTGALPREGSLIDTTGSDVAITCVKKAEDSGAVVVRGYNPRSAPGRLRLATGARIAEARSCSIDERSADPIAHGAHILEWEVPAKRIFLVALRFGEW